MEECDFNCLQYPIYDFDLQPGDLVALSIGDVYYGRDDCYYLQWVRCIDRREVEVGGSTYEEIEVWYIGPVARDGFEDDPNVVTYEEAVAAELPESPYKHTDVWIDGIGQKYGLLHCTPWSDYVGGAYTLYSVQTANDDFIYKDTSINLPEQGVEGLTDDNTDNSKIYHLDGTIAKEGEKGIFIRNGKKYIVK